MLSGKSSSRAMRINCPYCKEITEFDSRNLPEGADHGDDIAVSCEHCNRQFFAKLCWDIHLHSSRKCDCLNDQSLCEMEDKVRYREAIGLKNIHFKKCRNCEREER